MENKKSTKKTAAPAKAVAAKPAAAPAKAVKKAAAPAKPAAAKPAAAPAKAEKKAAAPVRRRITFSIEAGVGKQVAVAGSFNDWDPAKTKLADRNGDGVYTGVVILAPGEYEYKFVVDGDWRIDENNQNFASNDLGTLNSVLRIEAKK